MGNLMYSYRFYTMLITTLLIIIDIFYTLRISNKLEYLAKARSLKDELYLLDMLVNLFLAKNLSLGKTISLINKVASEPAKKILFDCLFKKHLFDNSALGFVCNEHLPISMKIIQRVDQPRIWANIENVAKDIYSHLLASISKQNDNLQRTDDVFGLIIFFLLFLPMVLIEFSIIFSNMSLILIIPLINILVLWFLATKPIFAV